MSNRTPYSFDSTSQSVVKGSGGLVSALLAIKSEHPLHWLGIETDVQAAHQLSEYCSKHSMQFDLHPVIVPLDLYKKFYDGICNDVLWPLFHYESQLTAYSQDNWQAYIDVNQQMADRICELATANDLIWIHDFHFFLLPKMLKQRNPLLRVGFFLHIPFPSSEIFRQLPVRDEVLKGLVAADLIGFHEHSYLRHFTVSLKSILGIDTSVFQVDAGDGRHMRLGIYPISVDTQLLKQKAQSDEVQQLKSRFETNNFTFLGVDRLDYAKGIELKLRGFRRALQKYPELRGKINLLQIAVPTRTRVPAYIRLKHKIDQLVGNINGEYGRPDYTPVRYMFNSVSEPELLALYRSAECLLVTSKRDGMNLVCMEYLLSQDPHNPGSVILSEFAGAASLLADVILVNPWDADSIAEAISKCFNMRVSEKIRVHSKVESVLSLYSASEWASGFLADLDRVSAQPPSAVRHISPQFSHWPDSLRETVNNGEKIFLFLDYDGTLVPIYERPEMALIDKETLDVLDQLRHSQDVEICLVSGRSKSFLMSQFSQYPFHLSAEHGAFFKEQGSSQWTNFVTSHLQSWYSEAFRLMEDYTARVPHSHVETKESSITWHFRQSPVGFAEYQARKLAEELQVGLANFPVSVVAGSKIVDARAAECNKGDFLRLMMRDYVHDRKVICIGDDRTDEDMFEAVGNQGVTIKVGAGSTRAQYRFQSQKDVLIFLKSLLESLTSASSDKILNPMSPANSQNLRDSAQSPNKNP